jgi:hypothetical protein
MSPRDASSTPIADRQSAIAPLLAKTVQKILRAGMRLGR